MNQTEPLSLWVCMQVVNKAERTKMFIVSLMLWTFSL